MSFWSRRRCRRKGHQWFPDAPVSEYLCLVDVCLRCGDIDIKKPWGMCLGGHPLADHYDDDGNQQPALGCSIGAPA